MKDMVSRISRGQGNEFLNKLEDAGLDSELAQKVIDSKGNFIAGEFVRLIKNGGVESASQQRAREIMGENFFGIEEAIKYFEVKPSKAQLIALAEVPFTEEILLARRKTHILVAVFPMSPVNIGRNIEYAYKCKFIGDLPVDGGGIGWHLVRKTAVPGSNGGRIDKQQALLKRNEKIPSVQVLLYTIVGHYCVAGECLFAITHVRTSTSLSYRENSVVRFEPDRIVISNVYEGITHEYLGLSSEVVA